MRIVRAVRTLLVAFVTVAMLALLVPALASAYQPGVAYPWAQPGAVAVGAPNTWVQPPAWISTATVPAPTQTAASLLNTTYKWGQPPAEIPAG